MRVRTPFSSSSNERVTGSSGSPSASSRSTASWRSSSSSKPRSSRSAMPPRTIRITGSQSRPTGVISSIMSADIRELPLGRRGWRRPRARRCDRRKSNHGVAAHEAGRLPGRHAVRRLVELERERAVAAGRRGALHGAADGPRAVAQLHAFDLARIAQKHGSGHGHTGGRERPSRADDYAVVVLAEHVERLGSGDADALALPDREAVLPFVAAESATALVDDVSGGVAPHEPVEARAGEEAEVLALGAFGYGEICRARELADLGLGELAEREPDPIELSRLEAGEHVGLVLVGIACGAEQGTVPVSRDSRVVAGGGPGRGEIGRAACRGRGGEGGGGGGR